MTGDALPLAAVIVAHRAEDAAGYEAMLARARDAGAEPVVLVLRRDAAVPIGARVARVSDGASDISALRAGMALLTNTTARLVLLWPAAGDVTAEVPALHALVAAARREGGAVTAFANADLDRSPVIVARDAWLELVTLGEQGLAAVAARRGEHRVTSGS